MVDMPEEWKAGILLPRFGLHIANTEHGVFTDYGYLVKSGDEWQRVHEGQPVPEQYRVMAYPAPEILREESKVQPEAAAPTKAPQPVTPILLNGQNSAERMKEITDRLETGIQELFESERYKAYLTTMSKFHSYSFNNTLLIAMQGGQLVAGYNNTAYYPSTHDLQSSLTLANSCSSQFTLKVMAYVSILVPFVLAYIFYAWRSIDNRKIDAKEMEEGGHAY